MLQNLIAAIQKLQIIKFATEPLRIFIEKQNILLYRYLKWENRGNGRAEQYFKGAKTSIG